MPWPPALQPRTTGTLTRRGYRIEKIVYQSLPGVEVPAHLYLPENLKARAPAILFYNGHWWKDSKTLPDHQAFCANMALRGFVVFSFDPFGQGERGVSTRDHRRVESLLAGISQQGFAEYETQCALEYLLSRKEVDGERIGLTGASGGGYNTWITSALDDRIKVAVPVVGTSDFYIQIHYARTVDWYHAAEHCHFVPGLIAFADNRELLAMAAPRPILIVNSTTDPGFAIGGVYEYGRQLYGAYGEESRIAFFHDATAGHGYQQKKREAAYGWFLKWLMGEGTGAPAPELPVELPAPDAPELRCFSDGQKRPSGPGMMDFIKHAARRIAPAKPVSPAQFFGSAVPAAPAPRIEDRPVQRLAFRTDAGPAIPAYLVRPPRERGLVVAVDDRGKEGLMQDPAIQMAIEQGWAVCGIDPRGIGELAVTEHGWLSSVSLLAGDNFVWRQAGDLLAAANALRSLPQYSAMPLGLYARGDNSALAATYAVGQAAGSFRWYALRDGFLSYRQFIDRPESERASYRLMDDDRRTERFTAFDREIPFWYIPFDVLRSFDLPQLLAGSGGKGVVIDPIDGDWKKMKLADARRLLPSTVTVTDARKLAVLGSVLR